MSEDSSTDGDRPMFRPFTRESLVKIEERITEDYAKKKELEKKRAEGEVRMLDVEISFTSAFCEIILNQNAIFVFPDCYAFLTFTVFKPF